MHMNPTGARFIVASKTCSTKEISKPASSVFKVLYSQIENFYKNAKFLPNYNKVRVFKNSELIIQSLNNINKN